MYCKCRIDIRRFLDVWDKFGEVHEEKCSMVQ